MGETGETETTPGRIHGCYPLGPDRRNPRILRRTRVRGTSQEPFDSQWVARVPTPRVHHVCQGYWGVPEMCGRGTLHRTPSCLWGFDRRSDRSSGALTSKPGVGGDQ